MSFHVGQKVQRIGGLDVWGCAPPLGVTCTIASVFRNPLGEMNLELVEYPTTDSDLWYPGVRAMFFRPVTKRKTDISIFESLLDPSNHKPLPEQQPKRQKVSHDLCGND